MAGPALGLGTMQSPACQELTLSWGQTDNELQEIARCYCYEAGRGTMKQVGE